MNTILSVGSKFPDFKKRAVVSSEAQNQIVEISNEVHTDKWLVLFWWSQNFTGVCASELFSFNRSLAEFEARDAVLVGASTDSVHAHLAWRNMQDELKNLAFPMLSDSSKTLAEELGILDSNDKVAYRVTYIVDAEDKVRWVCVNDMKVGRSVSEILRVLDALQTDEDCPCDWRKGDMTLAQVGV